MRRALAALILFAAQTAIGAPILITFDDRAGMANAPGTAVPLGSRLSDEYQGLTGAVFSSPNAPFVAVVDLQGCCNLNHAISNPNGIGGVDAAGRLSYATPFSIEFFEIGSELPGVTDFVSIRGDRIAIAGTATLTAFGLDGSLLGRDTELDVAGGLTLELSLPGIHRVVISETSATIAFDQLQFNAAVAAAPEPGSLLLVGIGLLGIFLGYVKARSTLPTGAALV